MGTKDYLAIGGVLAGEWNQTTSPIKRGVIWTLTLSIADKFAQDNDRFNRRKFYEYVFGTADHFGARNLCEF